MERRMEATLCDGNLRGLKECKLPCEEEEPTEKEETEEPGRATEATAKKGGRAREPTSEKEQVRSPTSSPLSAECAGGGGTKQGGKEEEPGAERTGGGQIGGRDD